jgi:ABC-type transport system substrate-binding protein
MPVGEGPYQFSDLKKDAEGNILWYELKANETYFEGRPYIDTINFRFYPDEDALITAYKQGEVMGMASIRSARMEELSQKKSTSLYSMNLPRAFSVFFNTMKNAAIAFDEVCEALALATDRETLVRDVLSGRGAIATTPFLPFMRAHQKGMRPCKKQRHDKLEWCGQNQVRKRYYFDFYEKDGTHRAEDAMWCLQQRCDAWCAPSYPPEWDVAWSYRPIKRQKHERGQRMRGIISSMP